MAGAERENPYAIPLDVLEDSAHVDSEDLTTGQPATPPDVTEADWPDARRQARLAGGA